MEGNFGIGVCRQMIISMSSGGIVLDSRMDNEMSGVEDKQVLYMKILILFSLLSNYILNLQQNHKMSLINHLSVHFQIP